MGRTERRVLVLSTIAFLLALGAVEGAAAPAPADGAASPPLRPAVSPLAFAERAAASGRASEALKAEGALREALELIALAAICGLAVACYSALGSGGQGGKRMRIRRR